MMKFARLAYLLAASACAAPHACATETCRYAGSSDYNGKIGVVTKVDAAGGAITVDVTVTLNAVEFIWLPLRYVVEERSTWRDGELVSLAANTRYSTGAHIVKQIWDEFQRAPEGLRGYRVEGKRAAEFNARYPGFAQYWDPAAAGLPWWQDFAAAPPQRRADLDLTGSADTGPLRTPFATAFYFVRYLPASGTHATVFLPGFKTYKTMPIAIAPAPREGGGAWRAPLHYIALSENPASSATAFVSADAHLQKLVFELHGSAGSARGLIMAQGCGGEQVRPR